MSDEKTKQNDKPKEKGKLNPQITAALIGAAAVIIAAIITAYALRPVTIEVYLTDKETNQGISGNVFIDIENNGVRTVPDRPAVIKVRRGDQYIRAESDNYKSELVPIARVAKTLTIPMEEMTAATSATRPVPLSLTGGRAWSNEITLRAGASANEIIINGAFSDAVGFYITGLPSAMRSRTLVLYFSNTGASRFSRSRMVKIEYNADDVLLPPTNASLENGEYLTAGDTPPDNGIEFPIPDNFNGRLNFTFYGATLNNLIIKAFYK